MTYTDRDLRRISANPSSPLARRLAEQLLELHDAAVTHCERHGFTESDDSTDPLLRLMREHVGHCPACDDSGEDCPECAP